MKRSSLLKRYKKALRENKNLKEDKRRHIKQNFVTKLFFRIFLSSVILLLACVIDAKISKKNNALKEYTLNTNINLSKPTLFLNSILGNYLNIDKDLNVSTNNDFEELSYENNKIMMVGESVNAVKAISGGIVIKKITEDNLYIILIQDASGYLFEYSNLIDCNVDLYTYITTDEIIGVAKYSDNQYSYLLTINKEGEYYSYQEYLDRL